MFASFITEQFPPNTVGGLGVHCHYLTKALAKLGHKIEVLTPGEKSKMEGFVDVKGIKTYKAKYMDFLLSGELRNWGDTSIMTHYLQFNILAGNAAEGEIVHCHDWLSILAGAIAKDRGKRVILTIHSTEKGRMGDQGSETVKQLEKLGGEIADRIITVSEPMRKEIIEIGYPEEKIDVIPNGIDCTRFSPKKVEKEKLGLPDEPIILFIGRLDRVKGIDSLISAMGQLKNSATLLVLGVGGWEGHLKNLAREAGAEDKVIFRNEFVSESERIELIAASDICCFPSRYEPFGIVALEGMAMAKPVIVGNVGGMKDAVGDSAIKVNPDNPNEIAEKLDLLLEDESLREKLSRKARARAESFDWDVVAKKTKRVACRV